MAIKDTVRQTKSLINGGFEKVVQHHSKEHRREVSQKITNKLHLQNVVDKSRNASDRVKLQVEDKLASQTKLKERSLLKLDAETHKKLLSNDSSVWCTALADKSCDQIGKYLDRAAEASNLNWPTKKDKEFARNLKNVFQSGGNPYEFALETIATVKLSKKAANKKNQASSPDVATLEKLAHLYCTALIEGLDSGPDGAKRSFFARVQRNTKTDVAVFGKRLEVLGKSLQQKAVRLPSSAVHGAANAVVAAPVVGGGVALLASSVAVMVASQGLAVPVIIGMAAMFPVSVTMVGTGAGLMARKSKKDGEEQGVRPPSYRSSNESDGTDIAEKLSLLSFDSSKKR